MFGFRAGLYLQDTVASRVCFRNLDTLRNVVVLSFWFGVWGVLWEGVQTCYMMASAAITRQASGGDDLNKTCAATFCAYFPLNPQTTCFQPAKTLSKLCQGSVKTLGPNSGPEPYKIITTLQSRLSYVLMDLSDERIREINEGRRREGKRPLSPNRLRKQARRKNRSASS